MQHADPANGGNADAVPPSPVPASSASRPQFPDETAPSDFDRLKDILFGDERGTLDRLDARIAALDRNQRDLQARLPAAIERAQEGAGAERIALVGGLGEPLRPYLSPDVAKRLVRPRRDAVDGAILLAGGTLDEAEGSS